MSKNQIIKMQVNGNVEEFEMALPLEIIDANRGAFAFLECAKHPALRGFYSEAFINENRKA